MRTVFQIVQGFQKDARAAGLPIKWGPVRNPSDELGIFELPQGVEVGSLKHNATTKFLNAHTSINELRAAVQMLRAQVADAGSTFGPGSVLAAVEGSMLEIHGGVPLEWLDAVEVLAGPDVEWIGMTAMKKLHIKMRDSLIPLVEKADSAGVLLGSDWIIEIVVEGQKYVSQGQPLSSAFLKESMQLVAKIETDIQPFEVLGISAEKVTLKSFSDYSLAGEALEAAGKAAEVMRNSSHSASILEMASDYGPARMAAIWSDGANGLNEPFDDFEKMFRSEVEAQRNVFSQG